MRRHPAPELAPGEELRHEGADLVDERIPQLEGRAEEAERGRRPGRPEPDLLRRERLDASHGSQLLGAVRRRGQTRDQPIPGHRGPRLGIDEVAVPDHEQPARRPDQERPRRETDMGQRRIGMERRALQPARLDHTEAVVLEQDRAAPRESDAARIGAWAVGEVDRRRLGIGRGGMLAA